MIRYERRTTLVLYLIIAVTGLTQLDRTRYRADTDPLFYYEESDSNQKRHGQTSLNETRHIAFLKVHKAGSGTMKKVFLKFGHERNLTFVMPNLRVTRMRGIISETETLTTQNILPPPSSKTYDILCSHVIYNRAAFQKILPTNTVNIGIVRDPISRFQSAVNFYEPQYILDIQSKSPLSIYSANPLKFEPSDPRNSTTNNRMAVDFGFPEKLFPGNFTNSPSYAIQDYLKVLDEDFKLIMILEQFYESLVLMKRILHWQTRDIIFIKTHVSDKFSHRKSLKEADIANLRQFLYLDNALYKFALKKFMTQVASEGNDFQGEVEYFKEIIKRLQSFCNESETIKVNLVVKSTKWNKEFWVTKTDCNLLKMSNLNEIQRVRLYGSLD